MTILIIIMCLVLGYIGTIFLARWMGIRANESQCSDPI